MTTPLQRLPFLAQKEIIMSMDFDNIFMLSLTSRKTCRIIQAISFNRVTGVRCFVHYAGIHISVKILGAEHAQPIVGLSEVPFQVYIDGEMMNLKIGGLEQLYHKVWQVSCCLYFAGEPQTTMNSIFLTHLQSLFRQPLPIELFVEAKRRFAAAYHPIEGVRSLKLAVRTTDRRALDYIAQYQNLDSLVVDGKLTNLFDVRLPNLSIANAGEHGKRILESFEGRNLVLSNTSLSSADISKLVKKWQENQAFHNLEFLEVTLAGGLTIFEENEVLRGIEIAEGMNRPANFTPFFGIQKEYSTEGFRDIVRSADEKFASIRVTAAKLVMVIWQ